MSSDEAMQHDVAELLRALGLGDHARPVSCHRVMLDEIIPAVKRLATRRAVALSDPSETLARIKALLREIPDNVPQACDAYELLSKLEASMAGPPYDTLALIAEHRLTVGTAADGPRMAWAPYSPEHNRAMDYGPTIGDAVRACVARIQGKA